MNEPPNSSYFACGRSGQPIVCTTLRSGFATFQTSFTPSAQTCGLSPSSPNVVDRDSGQVALRALAEDRDARDDVEPGSKFGAARRSGPRPLSPVRTRRRAVLDEQLLCAVSGRIVAPASSACSASQRVSCERDAT
jgi:hypothetical protein